MHIFDTSLENIDGRRILGQGAFSRLFRKDLWKNLGKYVGKH